ncbi:MAG: hypothetical protein ABIG90_00835, partial [bacterium]
SKSLQETYAQVVYLMRLLMKENENYLVNRLFCTAMWLELQPLTWEAKGKLLVIKDQKVQGFYDTEMEAYTDANLILCSTKDAFFKRKKEKG